MSNPATKSVKGLARSLVLLAEGQRAIADMIVAIGMQGLGPSGNMAFSRARQKFEQVEAGMIEAELLTPRVLRSRYPQE